AIQEFEKCSGLKAFYRLRWDEFDNSKVETSVINFNSTGGNTHPQGVIRMIFSVNPPANKPYVAALTQGQGPPGRIAFVALYRERINPVFFSFAVVHELGHAVNIPHHASDKVDRDEDARNEGKDYSIAFPQGKFSGQWNCPMRYRGAAAY